MGTVVCDEEARKALIEFAGAPAPRSRPPREALTEASRAMGILSLAAGMDEAAELASRGPVALALRSGGKKALEECVYASPGIPPALVAHILVKLNSGEIFSPRSDPRTETPRWELEASSRWFVAMEEAAGREVAREFAGLFLSRALDRLAARKDPGALASWLNDPRTPRDLAERAWQIISPSI